MFNTEAAERLADKHHQIQQAAAAKNLHRASSQSMRTLTGQDDARSMALGARDAARKLQYLSSEVAFLSRCPNSKRFSSGMYTTILNGKTLQCH